MRIWCEPVLDGLRLIRLYTSLTRLHDFIVQLVPLMLTDALCFLGFPGPWEGRQGLAAPCSA